MNEEEITRIRHCGVIGNAIRDNRFSDISLQLICEIFGCTSYYHLSREVLKRSAFQCMTITCSNPRYRMRIDEADLINIESKIDKESSIEDVEELERYIGKSDRTRQLLLVLSEKVWGGVW